MMQHHFIYGLELLFLLASILGVESSVEKLKCYQCEVRESALCTDEYLQTCPDNQAYDSCMTRIYKTKDDGAWIHKSCALAPCSLRDQSQSTGLGLDHCERGGDEYDCISCCKESGCNTGAGAELRPATIMLVIAISIHVVAKSKFKWLV